MKKTLLILGNQLFPATHLPAADEVEIFMAEDQGLCTYVPHHQQKIVLFLSAMRSHADALREQGYRVHYEALEQNGQVPLLERLVRFMQQRNSNELLHFEIEDRPFEETLQRWSQDHAIMTRAMPSPMFLCSRQNFADYLQDQRKPSMASFYRRQRQQLGILVDAQGQPTGGRWSFDDENRKKLPASVTPPDPNVPAQTDHTQAVIALVTDRFGDHPGRAEDFCWPTTRAQALAWLEEFLDRRFAQFGPYEDAISQRSATLFHSLLSPLINLGLMTPAELVARALDVADDHAVPINSLEGFIRQVIGWREFVRGIDRHFGEQQHQSNHFGHQARLSEAWWQGDTGIPPLDDAIKGALRRGYNHHIERLMVIANLMNLTGIHPQQAYRWFMAMYVDSSDWVMGPNVFGMGLMSDGGIFASKPYICGSNYLLKMSDYQRGGWCDGVDGLYWGFVDRHRDTIGRNPRTAMMVRTHDRMDSQRRQRIGAAAAKLRERLTA